MFVAKTWKCNTRFLANIYSNTNKSKKYKNIIFFIDILSKILTKLEI